MKKKMKIILINTFHYYSGGDCVYTFNVSKLLQEKGNHKIVNFAMQHPNNLPSKYLEFFVPEINLLEELKKKSIKSGIKVLKRVIYSTTSKQKLSQLLDKYPVDIAHIQNIHSHITPSIFHTLKSRNIPIVWTLHDYFILCPNSTFFSKNKVCEKCKGGKFYNVLFRKCRKDSYAASFIVMFEEYIHRFLGLLKLVDFFITPSQFMRGKMIEYGFPSDKVIHVPHFIDVNSFGPLAHVNSVGYIIYIGRLSYEKGVATLIKSISIHSSNKLFIVGDGPMRAIFEKQVEVSKQKSKVKFLGFISVREKLKNVLREAAFAVFPSEWFETFGLGIVESYAMGKPVIGGNIGCIPELIKDGETGLLFEPGNSNDLAEKMQWMIDHPKERQEMGQRARELVEKEYNPELHYNRLMKVYKMALKKHGKVLS